jgi:serine protease
MTPMMRRTDRIVCMLALTLLMLQAAGSAAPLPAKHLEPTAARLIVKFREGPQKNTVTTDTRQRVTALALWSGVGMRVTRTLSGGTHLVTLDRPLPAARLASMAARISEQPEVEYAEPDARRYLMLRPNDPRFVSQHYLESTVLEPGAIDAPRAWDVSTGSAATVVAVLDSGILFDHEDIEGRTLRGYDFISADPGGGFFTASDGNGRDRDASDPGDGRACGSNESPSSLPSIWHGTRVASLAGAASNNGQGMAGLDWNGRLLPVRVISHCGAFISDIADAIRWAAGLPVPGVPDNPDPARIINLSFGGPDTCTQTEQAAIDDAVAAGALVVVAAGNEATNALRSSPANCKGVMAVASTDREGGLASFTNFGPKVALSAPGVAILTAANRGARAPIPNGDTYSAVDGTSLSAPLVAGVAALMLSLNDALTPQQLIGTLRTSARGFPTLIGGTACTTQLCGAGLLNAAAAVQAVATGNIAADDGGNGLRATLRTATPLPNGSSRNGSLDQPFQFDVYRVALASAGTLAIKTSGATDTYGYLFDADGRLLQQHDDVDPRGSDTDPSFNLNFELSAPLSKGTYYVAVEGFDEQTRGAYTINANASADEEGSGGGGAGGLFELALGVWVLSRLRQRRGMLRRRDQCAVNKCPATAISPPTAP